MILTTKGRETESGGKAETDGLAFYTRRADGESPRRPFFETIVLAGTFLYESATGTDSEEWNGLQSEAGKVFAGNFIFDEGVSGCDPGILFDDEVLHAGFLASLDDDRPIDRAFANGAEFGLAVEDAPILEVDLIHAFGDLIDPVDGVVSAASAPPEIELGLKDLGIFVEHIQDGGTALAALDSELFEFEIMVVVLDMDSLFGESRCIAFEFLEELFPIGERLDFRGIEPRNCHIGDTELLAVVDYLLGVFAELGEGDMGADRGHLCLIAESLDIGHVDIAGEAGDLDIVVSHFLDALKRFEDILGCFEIIPEAEHLGGNSVLGSHSDLFVKRLYVKSGKQRTKDITNCGMQQSVFARAHVDGCEWGVRGIDIIVSAHRAHVDGCEWGGRHRRCGAAARAGRVGSHRGR